MTHINSQMLCGCHIKMVLYPLPKPWCRRPKITFCPLHANAANLLSMLKLLADYWEEDHPKSPALERARGIIALAEGKPEKETSDV